MGASSFFPYPVRSGDERPDELIFTPERSPAQWDRLLALVEQRGFRAGEEVIKRGDSDRALYIVVGRSARRLPYVEQAIAPKPARAASGETLARRRAAPEPGQRPWREA